MLEHLSYAVTVVVVVVVVVFNARGRPAKQAS
jgi:hypothetical protein